MSTQELGRVDVIRDVAARRLTAAAVPGISRRQVFRLLRSFQTAGCAGLVSRRRGQPSNRRYPEAIRDKALSLVRERYADFGPTLVAEKLSEVHGLSLSRETLRQRVAWILSKQINILNENYSHLWSKSGKFFKILPNQDCDATSFAG